MALALLIVSCFLIYSTSRYFPEGRFSWIKKHKITTQLTAGAICLVSLYLVSVSYDFTTALMIWMIALMTLLSSMILSVKMNQKWLWVWGGLCLLFIMIDLY